MKQFVVLFGGLAIVFFLLSGFTINGVKPGAASSMTAVAIGSTTPVAVATCATSTTCQRKAIEFDNITGGVCYGAPASVSSPCGAASPAPNSSTFAGKPLQAGQSWTYRVDKDINPADNYICAEWDWVCTTAGTMAHEDLP